MTRTFIALDLNKELQRFLGVIISQASQELPDLRWVEPAGIHLTLAFLGELSDDQLAEAVDATEEAAQKAIPFEYRLKGLGIFGSPHQPRVIWMGVEDMPSGKIQGSPLQQLLLPDEQQRLHRLLHSKLAGSSSAVYQVNNLCVMKSELSRAGAKYTCLKECSFSKSNRLA